MRTNYFIWRGFGRFLTRPDGTVDTRFIYATVIIDADLRSWALPFAIHAGGPLLGKPGFHLRVLCFNIEWSKL